MIIIVIKIITTTAIVVVVIIIITRDEAWPRRSKHIAADRAMQARR